MKTFINGMGIVSPQHTFNAEGFLQDPIQTTDTPRLKCLEPSYKEFLDPILARRMGRIIKMGMASSTVCMREARVDMPDAILTGTALGCLEDTEKFLLSILENEEQFLTPTSFILSTHNTVGAQIALQLKCMNYNFTYVHKGFSFESAVLDALLTLREGAGKNILVGGLDEMTDKYFRVCDRVDYWKKDSEVSNLSLKNSRTIGSIAGEGSAFFMLSSVPVESTYAELGFVHTIFNPNGDKSLEKEIEAQLKQAGLTGDDIDLVLYGYNGDARFDGLYEGLRTGYLKNASSAWFKHLCGEYQTSSGFALWMACKMLKTGQIPEVCLYEGGKPVKLENILVVNSFMGTDTSVYLLNRYN